MEDDIRDAAKELKSVQQLALISAGLNGNPALAPFLVSADARFKRVVGGQLHSLNVRLVRYAISRWDDWALDVPRLKRLFADEVEGLQPPEKFNRRPLSDNEVLQFIREETDREPLVGHSVLLRRLRRSGRACEQGRFRRLFQTIKSSGST